MKVVLETRYLGADGKLYPTPEAAVSGEFETVRRRFVDWFQYRSASTPGYMHLSGTPDEVDKALDQCFETLRTIRAANHRRRLLKPR